jgi:hypothetical protein
MPILSSCYCAAIHLDSFRIQVEIVLLEDLHVPVLDSGLAGPAYRLANRLDGDVLIEDRVGCSEAQRSPDLRG